MRERERERESILKVERGFGTNKGEWTGKVDIRTKKKFLTMGESWVAIS